MKKTNKLLVAFASLGMVIAGGAAASIASKKAMPAQATGTAKSTSITLSKGVVGTNVITYASDAATFTILKGTASSFYTSNVSTPRIYQKNLVHFEANANCTLTSVVFTYSGTYKGASYTEAESATANGASTTVADITTAVTPTDDTTALTLTFTATTTNCVSWSIVNGVAGASPANVQLRPTAITINYVFSGVVVDPASITVTGTNALNVGASSALTAKVYGSDGTTLATNQNVTWASSNTNVAAVSSGGAVTGLNNGTATITATSAANTSITGSISVTVSGASTSAYDVTLLFSQFINAYTDGYQTVNSIAYYGVQVNGNTSYKEVVLGKNAGELRNATAYSVAIKTITITCYNTPTVTVKAGTTYAACTTAITATTSASVYTYDFSGGTYYFFDILNGSTTATAGFYSIVIEFAAEAASAVGTARTQAQAWLDGTATACTNLAVDSQDWDSICNDYTNLGAGVKAAFTNEVTNATYSASVTAIQKWVARYTYIVNKYTSYADPMGLRSSAAIDIKATLAGSDTASNIIVLVSLTIVLAGGAYLYIRRRKQA
jgi:hypothetical protein